jgi:hypothetical protein
MSHLNLSHFLALRERLQPSADEYSCQGQSHHLAFETCAFSPQNSHSFLEEDSLEAVGPLYYLCAEYTPTLRWE